MNAIYDIRVCMLTIYEKCGYTIQEYLNVTTIVKRLNWFHLLRLNRVNQYLCNNI